MAGSMYAIDPNYYSRQMGQASKKKRLLTGRGLSEEEALSGFYADIASRQAEMDAASLRKARQRQLDLESTKIENQATQFGKELDYKYAALDKDYSIASGRNSILQQQLENQERANMIQGALTLPTTLERLGKGGKAMYDMGKGIYDWINPSPDSYALPNAAGPEEYVMSQGLGDVGSIGGSDVTAGSTSAIENFGAMDAGAGLPGLEAPVAGWSMEAAAPGYMTSSGAAEWAAAEGGAYGAAEGLGALAPAGGFAAAAAAPLAIYGAARVALPAITDAIFGKSRHLSEYSTEELYSGFRNKDAPQYGNMDVAGELERRGMSRKDIGGTEGQWFYHDMFPTGGNFPTPQGVDWTSNDWRKQYDAWQATNPWGNYSFGGAAADGGPIEGGKAYLVGERGPELVVPRQDATVIPNHMLGGGSRPFRGDVMGILRGIGGIF